MQNNEWANAIKVEESSSLMSDLFSYEEEPDIPETVKISRGDVWHWARTGEHTFYATFILSDALLSKDSNDRVDAISCAVQTSPIDASIKTQLCLKQIRCGAMYETRQAEMWGRMLGSGVKDEYPTTFAGLPVPLLVQKVFEHVSNNLDEYALTIKLTQI